MKMIQNKLNSYRVLTLLQVSVISVGIQSLNEAVLGDFLELMRKHQVNKSPVTSVPPEHGFALETCFCAPPR